MRLRCQDHAIRDRIVSVLQELDVTLGGSGYDEERDGDAVELRPRTLAGAPERQAHVVALLQFAYLGHNFEVREA